MYEKNFYSWQNEVALQEKIAMDIDMAKHDKHYHRQGITENTKCKYRDTGTIEQDKTEANDIELKKVRKRLKEEFGITVLPIDKAMPIVSADSSTGFMSGWKLTSQPEKNKATKVVNRVLSVLDDLKSRFHLSPKIDLLLPVKFAPKENLGINGLSENDRQNTNLSKIAIGVDTVPYSGYSYGHKDSIKHEEDVIRHEIGHSLITKEIEDKFVDELKKFYETTGDYLEAATALKKSSSEYAMDAEGPYELIAEMFSRATSSDYKRGTMPKCFEDFIFNFMIGGNRG